MHHLFTSSDEGGPAGDTGSAMHKAAEFFHKGKEVAECIDIMKEELPKYPAADLVDAAGMFLSYAADPRNRNAKIILVEQAIRFSIAPSPEDHTQKAIEVIGTLDQVREEPDGLYNVDIKTSKKDPELVKNEATFQQAAYCIGASIFLGKRVKSAKILMPRLYAGKDPSTAPVQRFYPWKFEDIEDILYALRVQVANIRAGRIYHVPNKDCMWCPAKTPDICFPELQKLRVRC